MFHDTIMQAQSTKHLTYSPRLLSIQYMSQIAEAMAIIAVYFTVKFTFSYNIYSRCGNTTLGYIFYPISLNIPNTVFLIQGDQEDGDTNDHNRDTCDVAKPYLLLHAHGFLA